MGTSLGGATLTGSELIDLDDVPLSVLRTLDTVAIRRALRYIAEQTGRQAETETQCSSLTRF